MLISHSCFIVCRVASGHRRRRRLGKQNEWMFFFFCICLFCCFFFPSEPISRDKMMDVIFISEPICSAMREWHCDWASWSLLMPSSSHHLQHAIRQSVLWLWALTLICLSAIVQSRRDWYPFPDINYSISSNKFVFFSPLFPVFLKLYLLLIISQRSLLKQWQNICLIFPRSAQLQCDFFSSASGYLSCSFDEGLCGWIRDRDGDLHWETTPDPSGNWRTAASCLSNISTCMKVETQKKNNPQRGSFSSFQIRAQRYKGMQMRCGAPVLLAGPMTHTNGALFFLGLALGEKPCVLYWGEAKWRLNSGAGCRCLSVGCPLPVASCFHIFTSGVSQVWPHTSNK